MRSDLYSLIKSDYVRGLIMAILGAVLNSLYQLLTQGIAIDWKQVLMAGITAGIAYLIKTFFSDSDGKVVVGSKRF